MTIQMVDLRRQYAAIQTEIDDILLDTVRSGSFINGPQVHAFSDHLAAYTDIEHVIPCANGTDALQLALMALNLRAGDEVIVPAFTYVATAEVIGLLHLVPVMVEVDPYTFNLRVEEVRAAITPRTRAVIPVHLFGQSTDMEPLLALAEANDLYVVEDNAQSIGAVYTFDNGQQSFTGGMGHIGTTSFYPSKNLGAYGDGGALFTRSAELADRLRALANHGQTGRRYYHDLIGVNSRLDSLQAAILDVKLGHLNTYIAARQAAAAHYDTALADLPQLTCPQRVPYSTHVFHQYTMRVAPAHRDALRAHLQRCGVPTMLYYPVPLYRQAAYRAYWNGAEFPVTEALCASVLSLPMHTELTPAMLKHITDSIQSYFSTATA